MKFSIVTIFAGLFATAASASMSSRKTQIVMLGTGTPNADPDHSGPATAIVVGEQAYLVDFGPGVVRRAAAAKKKYRLDALEAKNLDIAFVTHLHSDHTAGYPDLILTPWVLDRSKPLRVYGPPGIEAMTGHILRAYAEDIDIRLHGGEPANLTGYEVQVHEVTPGEVYRDENVSVTAYAVKHGSWTHAFAYRFDTADRHIVISGDTAPTNAIIDACHGCDVLIHEVISMKTFAARPAEWQRYHLAFHTPTKDLARIASEARPKLLVLYHQLYGSGGTDAGLLRELREAGYRGKVVSAGDLDKF